MPKFSILTACHNDMPFLPAAVKSVLSQDCKDWEWIVVDDHSSDGSWEALKSIESKNIKVFRNEQRLHCSSTYARALQEASGEFCGVLDADDALAADAIKTILKRYRLHHGIAYIYTQHSWCDKKLRRRKRGLSSLPPKGMSFVSAAIRKKHCFSHWRTFRRSLVKNVDDMFPPGLECAVDKHMGFALEEMGAGAFLPRELYLYRYYKGNMSLTKAGEQRKTWQDFAKVYQHRRDKGLAKEYPIKAIK